MTFKRHFFITISHTAGKRVSELQHVTCERAKLFICANQLFQFCFPLCKFLRVFMLRGQLTVILKVFTATAESRSRDSSELLLPIMSNPADIIGRISALISQHDQEHCNKYQCYDFSDKVLEIWDVFFFPPLHSHTVWLLKLCKRWLRKQKDNAKLSEQRQFGEEDPTHKLNPAVV